MTVAAVTAVAATIAAVAMAGAALRWRVALARGTRSRRFGVWPALASRRRRERSDVSDRDMATWCEHAARAVRAGASLATAITDASVSASGPGRLMTPVVDGLRRGASMSVALDRVTVEPGRPQTAVVAVLRACAEIGGPAAPPLERVAAVLHARADAAAERWAHSAQARLSARVLTVLPAGVGALLLLAEPSIRQATISPAGLVCVVVGVALNVLGWWWMRRTIGSAR